MYRLVKVNKLDIRSLTRVASILNSCGHDMAKKYNIHHWDNSYIKTLIIVGLCAYNNAVYLLYDGIRPVATFMTNKNGQDLHFEKLGTLPSESGKGIGSICIDHIEQIAVKSGCKKVTMEVYEPSEHARQFYERKGYNYIGITDTLKYREVIMEKSV